MLTDSIKRLIDNARDTLVGKVPDPKGQIEQITNALIYKFMSEIDHAATQISGGKASFFVGDLRTHAWPKLFDSKLDNRQKADLYTEGIDKLTNATHLPPLFRDIFKNAFIPFRDSDTIALFLKEINDFPHYQENSEDLGSAFEYLLHFMGVQGDAGQFRTPRHIIDFIVDVVAPQKGETILDPACGTAGFLVSAYKHIAKGPSLTQKDIKTLSGNIAGVDIDPQMAKIARVNLYLHGFKTPRITEDDTLTNENLWGKKYHIILANPPFMTPKGGINPHDAFGIKANRSEVLFVDYIAEHLRLKGRAGVVVPEGIIFQAAHAYKELRKRLIHDWGLYAVVSLPQGVFNPYSGVRTSILFLDRGFTTDEILFVKVAHDGYDLGAQRREIDKNDLPHALHVLQRWRSGKSIPAEAGALAHSVRKTKIAENKYNLTGGHYRETADYSNIKWKMVTIAEAIEPVKYTTKIPKSEFGNKGTYPIIDQSENFIAGYWNESSDVFKITKPVTVFGDHTRCFKYIDFDFVLGADGVKLLIPKDTFSPKFFYYICKNIQVKSLGYSRHYKELAKTKIPLPPLEVQEKVVVEIDGYQKVIDGAKQVVANWTPQIKVNPDWEIATLGEICNIGSSKRVLQSEWKNEGVPFYRAREIVKLAKDDFVDNALFISTEMFDEYSQKYGFPQTGDVMVTGVGTLGISYLVKEKDKFYFKDGNILWLKKFSQKVISKFVKLLFDTDFIKNQIQNFSAGVTVGTYTIVNARKTKIPLPSLDEQKKIVAEIESEQAAVNHCKELIATMNQKIADTIGEVWR